MYKYELRILIKNISLKNKKKIWAELIIMWYLKKYSIVSDYA